MSEPTIVTNATYTMNPPDRSVFTAENLDTPMVIQVPKPSYKKPIKSKK